MLTAAVSDLGTGRGMTTAEVAILLLCSIVTAFTPIMLWFLTRSQQLAQKLAAQRAEGVRADLRTTAAVTDKKLDAIHTMVNGERARMVARLEAMHAEILRLTSANVTLKTEARNGS